MLKRAEIALSWVTPKCPTLEGTEDVEKCEIRTLEPRGLVLKQTVKGNKFIQNEDVFLLYDEKNRCFQLLVGKRKVSLPLEYPLESEVNQNYSQREIDQILYRLENHIRVFAKSFLDKLL